MIANVASSPASGLRSVRIRIRCTDAREFQERFAPSFAADGIFLPGKLLAPVGTALRVTVELRDGHRVLSGTVRVDARLEMPAGTQLRFLRLDPGSMPLAPILTPAPPTAAAGAPMPVQSQSGLRGALFADREPPEDLAGSRPLVVRSRPVKLRLRPTVQPKKPPGVD